MKFYAVLPDSPAYARDWVADRQKPHIITSAAFDFVAPMKSSIITHSGAYAVSEELATKLRNTNLTGFEFVPTEAGVAEWTDSTEPVGDLPTLCLLVVRGQAMQDDAGLNGSGKLIVSDELLGLVKEIDPEIERFKRDVDDSGNVVYLKFHRRI